MKMRGLGSVLLILAGTIPFAFLTNTSEAAHRHHNHYLHKSVTVVAAKPVKATVLTVLPRGYRVVRLGAQSYYVHNGVHYRRMTNGFVVVRPVPPRRIAVVRI